MGWPRLRRCKRSAPAALKGRARNQVGRTLLAMERWADAEVAYREALIIWEAHADTPNRYEGGGRASALRSGSSAARRRSVAFCARRGINLCRRCC